MIAFLEMMVDGGHPEKAPAVRSLEKADLQDYRERFDDEDAPGNDEHELLLAEDSQEAEDAAEAQRAHIAHEHLGWHVLRRI